MIRRWLDLWDARESPLALALVRIALALALLGDLLQARLRGAVEAVWAPPPFGAGESALQSAPLMMSWLGRTPLAAHLTWWLAVAAALCVALGLAFRVSSWLLVFAVVQLWRLDPDGGDGIDALFRVVLPLLALSSAHAAWSFDAWVARRWREPLPELVPAWPRYLMVVQLLWLYFSAAHHRGKASWGPAGGFSAVGEVLGDPHFARFFPGTLQVAYPMMQLATALTMVFEYGAPLLLLWTWLDRRPGRGGWLGAAARRWHIRWAWLGLGVSLHLGIAVTMQLGVFPFGILALYPALLAPEEISAGLRRLGVRA